MRALPQSSGQARQRARRDGCGAERDALGRAAVDTFADWLGQGLSIVADVLDPELIVLGGGVSDDADLFIDRARGAMTRDIVGAGYRPLPTLIRTELGPEAGMIGVADLARKLV